MQDDKLENAYQFCENIVRHHYENFPVASWFLPSELRRPIAVIYAFARTADDMADEGALDNKQRLSALEEYEKNLSNLTASGDPVFIALSDVIQTFHLPLELFHDLIAAFKQDTQVNRYQTFEDILLYCQKSANPIGRLLLYLNGQVSEKNLILSDSICAALQLINFYQDLAQDYHENKRIYIPLDEMQKYGVDENIFSAQKTDQKLNALMHHQVIRAREMLLSGRELGTIMKGRVGFEMRMVIAGGLIICEKLLNNTENAFARPRLNKLDILTMCIKATFKL